MAARLVVDSRTPFLLVGTLLAVALWGWPGGVPARAQSAPPGQRQAVPANGSSSRTLPKDMIASGPQASLPQEFRSGLFAFHSGDYSQALQAWLAAAKSGDAQSQAGLAFMYYRGLGVAADTVVAAYWAREAALQDQPEGQALLGTLHLEGRGVERNLVYAFVWCEIALSNGSGWLAGSGGCRGNALAHMTDAEQKEGFRIVAAWWNRDKKPR